MPYQAFTVTRATEPDPATLLALLRALDNTAGVQHTPGTLAFILKKNTAWTAPAIAAAQNVLDTAPASTVQLSAQSTIDQWPRDLKAAFILVMDQVNVLRAALTTLGVPNLPPFTEQQFYNAIKAKAATTP